MSNPKTKTKIIEVWECPVCGKGPIVVDFILAIQHGFTEDSQCECYACGEIGAVRDFMVQQEVSDE